MKLYGRKFVNKHQQKALNRRIETRDGIVWSIDSESQTCNVRIQGTSKNIVAHFYRNRTEIPSWLRIGSSVNLRHKEGMRGFIEASGSGRAIPQPISGGKLPDPGSIGGGIVSGMLVNATNPPTSSVFISTGVYSIGGTNYIYSGGSSDYVTMNDPAPMTMGLTETGTIITMGQTIYTLGDPPDYDFYGRRTYRYDAIVVNASGETSVIEGVAALSNPEKPSVGSSYVVIAYILRISGVSSISDYYIGMTWSEPKPTEFVVAIAASLATGLINSGGSYIEYGIPEYHIEVVVSDQYGNVYYAPESGMVITMKLYGTLYGFMTIGYTDVTTSFKYEPPFSDEGPTSYIVEEGDFKAEFTYIGLPGVVPIFNLIEPGTVSSILFGAEELEDEWDWEYPY